MPDSRPTVALRLLIADLADLRDDRSLARLTGEHRPDVAVLHGAPSLARWRSACAAIARDAGMVVVGGGRTGGGTLLLANLGVDADLPRELSFGRHIGPRPPGAVLATMRRLGAPFVIAGAREVGTPADRVRQSRTLRDALDAMDPLGPDHTPAVLAVHGLRLDSAAPLAPGRAVLPGGLIVDERITVEVQDVPGGVRAELAIPEAARVRADAG